MNDDDIYSLVTESELSNGELETALAVAEMLEE